MELKRYILVHAILVNGTELIPIWDKRLEYQEDVDCGSVIRLRGTINRYYAITECVYDLKTHKLSPGVYLDYYPENNEYAPGVTVYYEVEHRKLKEAKIVDVVYEEYEMEIVKGRKMDNWWILYFKDKTKIEVDVMYAIRKWKPYYILDNGVKIKWEHQLNLKAE